MIYVHKCQNFPVLSECFARGQLQVRSGFNCVESVGETHRSLAGKTGSISAKKAQALKFDCRGGAVVTIQIARTTMLSTGSEFPIASDVWLGAGVDLDRSGTIKIAFGFALKQLACKYRDDRAS